MSETKASELFEVGVAHVCIQPGDRERRLSQLKITTVLRIVREGIRANNSNARSVAFQKQKRARTTSYVSYDSAACITRRRMTNLGVTVDAVCRSPWSLRSQRLGDRQHQCGSHIQHGQYGRETRYGRHSRSRAKHGDQRAPRGIRVVHISGRFIFSVEPKTHLETAIMWLNTLI
ncbi:hypothetical protein JG687_00000354 [Phytophthora cactorum]|uniref:Uncharacterized protein n=1 Tax=Phytophthora cactorum TaxID=29920 RepID=A0A8T1V2Y2_9STRA|nr:hypothetical protein GQ600_27482 [Phytophthora cactorum]KAG6974348.1 hypothetical protein JG687_00000354 [Phytophthora cactorum]